MLPLLPWAPMENEDFQNGPNTPWSPFLGYRYSLPLGSHLGPFHPIGVTSTLLFTPPPLALPLISYFCCV